MLLSVTGGRNSSLDDMLEKRTSKEGDRAASSSKIKPQEQPKRSGTPKAKPGREVMGKKATKKSPRREINAPKAPTKKPQKTAEKSVGKKSEKPTKKVPRSSPTQRKSSPKKAQGVSIEGSLSSNRISMESLGLQAMRSKTSIASKLSFTSRSSRRSTRSRSSKNLLVAEGFKMIRRKAKQNEPLPGAEEQSKESAHEDDLSSSESDTLETYQSSLVETVVVEEEAMELSQRLAFLQVLKDLPDIRDLSETTTIESIPIQDTEEANAERLTDTGHFVDGVASNEHSESDTGTQHSLECEATEHRADRTADDSESLDMSLATESESGDDFAEPPWTEESVDDITKSMMSIVFTSDEAMPVLVLGDDLYEVYLANMETCQQLLTQLINEAVNYAESDYVRLTRVLDKEKMMKQLYKLTVDYSVERHRNTKLDNLVCEFYLRKKCMGFISGPKGSDAFSRTRYRNAILELDSRLSVEIETEKKKESIIKQLRDEEEAATVEADEKVRHFENNVMQTLCFRDGFDHLKALVGVILRGISRFREEVDQVRLALLLTQHQNASLTIQLDKMENLGDGLKMHEYLSNQATNQSLGIKINERNGELKRLNRRITHDTHALAHFQNKELMNGNILARMKIRLHRRIATRENLRMIIYTAKIRHLNLKNEKKRVRAAGCLMHYPGLMKDYDVTLEQLEAKRNVVQKLRLEHARLEHRVEHVGTIIAETEKRLRSVRSLTLLK
ncbi:uncharacterized protein LOC111077878 [Drosophila obscura]|uniref:uncharacterized protein LOC111077878 n=1 Tax=Drosophila obscura TaxID=7282 RepID=UPI001BB15754|nr:uncharacterized protein LOC111077878 [Drosophila obscura]